jgi:hypothetical protein
MVMSKSRQMGIAVDRFRSSIGEFSRRLETTRAMLFLRLKGLLFLTDRRMGARVRASGFPAELPARFTAPRPQSDRRLGIDF